MAPLLVDTVQPLRGEHKRMLRLGHQDFLNGASARGQAFQGQSGAARREGHHLQVEVVTAQKPPVQGGELNHHLLAQTERPAGVKEQATQILRLKGRTKGQETVKYVENFLVGWLP